MGTQARTRPRRLCLCLTWPWRQSRRILIWAKH